MTDDGAGSYSETELENEFERLFPQGFAGADVLQELAPGGWENSPLRRAFHPTLEQVYEETLRMHRNIGALRRADDRRPFPPEPTREEVAGDFRDRPIEPQREVAELVGQCLWDVFSDNHEVISNDGRVLDLGSFRAGGGFLAEALNRQIGAPRYGYLDFYMGTIWVAQRADLTPVYRMIFARLRRRALDWIYHFPRIEAVDMRPLRDVVDSGNQDPDWLNYSPDRAFAEDVERQEQDRELAELREALDEGYREAIEEALQHPPPATVRAYAAVYGCSPRGWPPSA